MKRDGINEIIDKKIVNTQVVLYVDFKVVIYGHLYYFEFIFSLCFH